MGKGILVTSKHTSLACPATFRSECGASGVSILGRGLTMNLLLMEIPTCCTLICSDLGARRAPGVSFGEVQPGF